MCLFDSLKVIIAGLEWSLYLSLLRVSYFNNVYSLLTLTIVFDLLAGLNDINIIMSIFETPVQVFQIPNDHAMAVQLYKKNLCDNDIVIHYTFASVLNNAVIDYFDEWMVYIDLYLGRGDGRGRIFGEGEGRD